MSLWMLTVSLGNAITGIFAFVSNLELAPFFWTFAALTTLVAILFTWRARTYRYRTPE